MNSSGLYSGNRFRQAIVHYLLGRTAQAISSFIFIIWLVRLLSPIDYGAYMVLWGMVEMMAPLSSLGMLEAVRRFLPELALRGAPSALAWFVRWMTLIRFAIMIIWTALISAFWLDISAWLGFSTPQQDATLVAVGLIITVIGFRYASEMLESLLEQRWAQLIHSLMSIGRLAGVAILVLIESLSIEQLLWMDLIVSLVCLIWAEFLLMRKLRSIQSTGDFHVSAYEIFNFAWHMAGVNLLRAVANPGALRMLVARTLGLETAGMFAFLQQLLLIAGRYLPAKLLANIIRPMLISRYVAGEVDVVKEGMALLWKSNFLIIAICMAALSVAGNELIALASSGRFTDAGMVMVIMLLGLGATSQGQLVVMIMQIFPYTRQLRYLSILSAITPIAVIIGSNWGLMGVVCGIVLGAWLMNSLTLLWLNYQAGRIQLDWLGTIRGLSIAIFLAAIGWAIEDKLGVWWTLTFVLVAYVPGLMLVKPLNQLDMALLNRGLRHRARIFLYFTSKSL